ncbi:hypothetical protein LTR05_008657 [Lithohypha guttulata]|uniref:Uncharacterized protein n=1 Tax=Lithohypha guttulata TaxID=1690604 RepID=A0AAN7PJM2_9EURO|nr:hypothetical protein LTR05_008657 [Lithohypha guttulata]
MDNRVQSIDGWVIDQEYQILEALMSQEEHNARSSPTVTAQGDGYDARLALEGPLESMLPFDSDILERFSEDYKENPKTFNSQETTPNAQPDGRRRSASPIPAVLAQPEPLQYTAARNRTTSTDSESRQIFTHDQVYTNSKQVMLDIDWNDVELELDATQIGDEIVLMPMIDLMPEEKEFSNWYDFDIETLMQRFQKETGITIDTRANVFVVVNEDGDKSMTFRRNGGYQIALKRFAAEYADKTNVLRLQVEPRPLPRILPTPTTTHEPIIGTVYHEQQATVTAKD